MEPLSREPDMLKLWMPYYLIWHHITREIGYRSGNYVWRKVWWKVYRIWYED